MLSDLTSVPITIPVIHTNDMIILLDIYKHFFTTLGSCLMYLIVAHCVYWNYNYFYPMCSDTEIHINYNFVIFLLVLCDDGMNTLA